MSNARATMDVCADSVQPAGGRLPGSASRRWLDRTTRAGRIGRDARRFIGAVTAREQVTNVRERLLCLLRPALDDAGTALTEAFEAARKCEQPSYLADPIAPALNESVPDSAGSVRHSRRGHAPRRAWPKSACRQASRCGVGFGVADAVHLQVGHRIGFENVA